MKDRVPLRRNSFEPDLGRALSLIALRRRAVPSDRAMLVGISGIDGAGKGFIAERLREARAVQCTKVALIGADPLQNPLTVRLSEVAPDRHFYDHVFRWEELFYRIVDPLVATRSVDVVVSAIRGDVDRHYPKQYR